MDTVGKIFEFLTSVTSPKLLFNTSLLFLFVVFNMYTPLSTKTCHVSSNVAGCFDEI